MSCSTPQSFKTKIEYKSKTNLNWHAMGVEEGS